MSIELEELIEKEVSKWAGVRLEFTTKNKHPRAVLEYNGQSKFVPYTKTRTDYRGQRNKIADIRRVCSELGATKTEGCAS